MRAPGKNHCMSFGGVDAIRTTHAVISASSRVRATEVDTEDKETTERETNKRTTDKETQKTTRQWTQHGNKRNQPEDTNDKSKTERTRTETKTEEDNDKGAKGPKTQMKGKEAERTETERKANHQHGDGDGNPYGRSRADEHWARKRLGVQRWARRREMASQMNPETDGRGKGRGKRKQTIGKTTENQSRENGRNQWRRKQRNGNGRNGEFTFKGARGALGNHWARKRIGKANGNAKNIDTGETIERRRAGTDGNGPGIREREKRTDGTETEREEERATETAPATNATPKTAELMLARRPQYKSMSRCS